jgi:arginase
MRIVLIDVPYDCGQPRTRMGAGPELMLAWSLRNDETTARHRVRRETASLPARFHTEWDALVTLQSEVTRIVSGALAARERPIILSGNCAPALLGALGATGSAATAVCWFDAHADFNTPDTSPSGFLDGMALAIAVGGCWTMAARRFQGVSPLPETHVIQIGARSFDRQEAARLERSHVVRVARGELRTLRDRVRALPSALPHLYLHIDLDVLDPSELRANSYAEPDGLTTEELVAAIHDITRERPWTVAALTSLDPGCDDGRAAAVVERLMDALLPFSSE